MEVSAISFEQQYEYVKDVHYLHYYLNDTDRNIDPHVRSWLLYTSQAYLAPFGYSPLLSRTDGFSQQEAHHEVGLGETRAA